MSIINTNPANQQIGASGGQVFVPISGTLPVGIVGTIGSTTFVDVNSNLQSDAVSTGTDALATQAFAYGYYEAGDEWARIRAVTPLSGGAEMADLSGFALATASLIVDAGGRIANIGLPNIDAKTATEPALDIISKLYGYNRVSGGWARVDVINPVSGGMPEDDSGFAMLTASVIGMPGGNSFASVNSVYADTENAPSLMTSAFMHGVYRNSGNWTRLTTVMSSGTDNGDVQYSGFALVVSIGDAGNIAHTTPTLTHGETAEHSLFTAAFVMGNDADTSDWYKISARGNSDGAAGMALEVSDTPVANSIDISRVTCTNSSGGTVLPTFGILGVLHIMNESGNNTMNVGGNNAGDFPANNQGYPLYGGQSMTLKISNAEQVAVWAATSGERIRILATN